MGPLSPLARNSGTLIYGAALAHEPGEADDQLVAVPALMARRRGLR